MTFWQCINLASALLFIFLFLLCVYQVIFWVFAWQDKRNHWYYLYKYLHLPFKVNRRGRPQKIVGLLRYPFVNKVLKTALIVVVFLINYIIYFDLLKLISFAGLKHYPLLITPSFVIGLAILLFLEPFIVIGVNTIGSWIISILYRVRLLLYRLVYGKVLVVVRYIINMVVFLR